MTFDWSKLVILGHHVTADDVTFWGLMLAIGLVVYIGNRSIWKRDFGAQRKRELRVWPKEEEGVILAPAFWPLFFVQWWAIGYWNREVKRIVDRTQSLSLPASGDSLPE